jgi:hypothetical protein
MKPPINPPTKPRRKPSGITKAATGARVALSPVESALFEIKEERPSLSYEALFQDKEAVEASMPAILYIFKKKGFNEDDALMAAAAGWRHLRAEKLPPQTLLSPQDLINFVADIGKLTIKSNPDGADVEVDGKKLPRRTMTIAWCTPGKHRVRIVKEGYQPIEDVCEVKSDEPTECEIKLAPVQ